MTLHIQTNEFNSEIDSKYIPQRGDGLTIYNEALGKTFHLVVTGLHYGCFVAENNRGYFEDVTVFCRVIEE